jgi:hypothetical protein
MKVHMVLLLQVTQDVCNWCSVAECTTTCVDCKRRNHGPSTCGITIDKNLHCNNCLCTMCGQPFGLLEEDDEGEEVETNRIQCNLCKTRVHDWSACSFNGNCHPCAGKDNPVTFAAHLKAKNLKKASAPQIPDNWNDTKTCG